MRGTYARLVGTAFPEFSLEDDEGGTVDRDSILGGWTVMFFYPKDHSPGCTMESCAFRDSHDCFKQAGVTVYGVSTDSIESHRAFRAKHGLQYNLLSDRGGILAKALGLKKSLGFIPARTTLVIDESGIVQTVYTSHTNMRGHVTEALKAIES
jgi:peroxiredoxin Q/BCP